MKLVLGILVLLMSVWGSEAYVRNRHFDIWICDLKFIKTDHPTNPCTEVIAMQTAEELDELNNRKRVTLFPQTRKAILDVISDTAEIITNLIKSFSRVPFQIAPENPRSTHIRFWHELIATRFFFHVIGVFLLFAVVKTYCSSSDMKAGLIMVTWDAIFIALALFVIYALIGLVPHFRQLEEKYKLLIMVIVLLISVIPTVRCLLVLSCEMIFTTYLQKILLAGLLFALLAGPAFTVLENGIVLFKFTMCNSTNFIRLMGTFFLALIQPLYNFKFDSESTLPKTFSILDSHLDEIINCTRQQFPKFGDLLKARKGLIEESEGKQAYGIVNADLGNSCRESYAAFTRKCLENSFNRGNPNSAVNVCKREMKNYLHRKVVFFMDAKVPEWCDKMVLGMCDPDISTFCSFHNPQLEQKFGSALQKYTVSQRSVRKHFDVSIQLHPNEDFGYWIPSLKSWSKSALNHLRWLLQQYTKIGLYVGLAIAVYSVAIPFVHAVYYLLNYRRNLAYDNVYLNKPAKELLGAVDGGLEGHPLRSYETVFLKRQHLSIGNLLQSVMALENLSNLVWVFTAVVLFLTDHILKRVIWILREHSIIEAKLRGRFTADFVVHGKSILARVVRTLLKFLDIDINLDASLDTRGCILVARQTDKFYMYVVIGCLVALLLLNPIREILFATRSVICDHFFPELARQRGDLIVRVLFSGRQKMMDLKAALIEDMVQKWNDPEHDYAARMALCCPTNECSLHTVTDALVEKVPCCAVISLCRTVRHTVGCHPFRTRCQVCGRGASGYCQCRTFQLCTDCLLDLAATCPACDDGGLPPPEPPVSSQLNKKQSRECGLQLRCLLLNLCSMAGSALLAYFFFNMAMTLKLPQKVAIAFGGLFFLAGLPCMPQKLRCLSCLCLGELATQKGRTVILGLLVTSLYYGPVQHLHTTTEHVATSMTCISVEFQKNIKETQAAFMNDTDVDFTLQSVQAIMRSFEELQHSTEALRSWYDETMAYASRKGYSADFVKNKLHEKCHNHLQQVKRDCMVFASFFVCQVINIAYPFCTIINSVVDVALPIIKNTIVTGLQKLWVGFKAKIGQIVNLRMHVNTTLTVEDEDMKFLQEYAQKLHRVFKEEWSVIENAVSLTLLTIQWFIPFCLIIGPCYYLCRYLHQTDFDNLYVTHRMAEWDRNFSQFTPVNPRISLIKTCCGDFRTYALSVVLDLCLGCVIFGVAYFDWASTREINLQLSLLKDILQKKPSYTLFVANVQGSGAIWKIVKKVVEILTRMQQRAGNTSQFVNCLNPIMYPTWRYIDLGITWGTLFTITALKPIVKVSAPLFANAFFPRHEALRFRSMKLNLAYQQAIEEAYHTVFEQ